MGLAVPIGPHQDAGVLFAMEPKFALMDKLSVGLRIEAAVLARVAGSLFYGNAELDNARAAGSYVATVDYYFTTNYSFRPFAGAGAGVFVTAEDDTNSGDAVTAVKFRIIRVGGEVDSFVRIEYNIIRASDINIYTYDNMGNLIVGRGKSKNAYIGIKVGFCFGGALL